MLSLSDPTKRVRIHDAIRNKALNSRKRLSSASRDSRIVAAGMPSLMSDEMETVSPSVSDDELIERLSMLLADEGVADQLSSIPEEELKLLQSELYKCSHSSTEVSNEWLRSWLQLRKHSDLFESYSTLPAEERNIWSAWYLRDVRGR